ncbi:MAG: tetratricopeptide repeat protein [Candidatus Margulisiibacteriota bacterium]
MTASKSLAKDTRLILVIVMLSLVAYGLWQSVLPWRAEYYYRKGFVENTYRKYNESISSLDRAMKYAPWETYYLITQVRNYEELSRQNQNPDEQRKWLLKAKNTYDYMLRINPTNPWYWSGLASIELGLFNMSPTPQERKAHFEAAGKAYSEAARIDRLNPLFQMSLAYYDHRSGKLDDAYKLYESCIRLDKDFVEALYNMAEIDIIRGKLDSAVEKFEQIVSADRANYDPSTKTYSPWVKGGDFNGYRTRLAEIYLSQHKFKSAIDTFKWALELHPEDSRIWRGLGVAYHQDGQSELAAYAYKQATMFNPDMQDVNKYQAYLYYNMGLLNSAIENLRQYSQMNPGDEKARSDLERMIMMSRYKAR